MAIRMTGLVSNLDTEGIIKQLMDAQNTKKTKVNNKITKLEWKQEKWKDLNAKIYNLYTDTLSKARTQGSYLTKKATSTNESKLKVTAGIKAAVGTHTVTVQKLASSQYITGKAIGSYVNEDGETVAPTGSTKLSDIGFDTSATIRVQTAGAKTPTDIEVTEDTTIAEFVSKMNSAGINASFDDKYGRIFLSSKGSGSENAFSITSGTVSSAAEKDAVRAAVGYENLSESERKTVDNLISDYRSAVQRDDEDGIEEAADKLYELAKDKLTKEITETATEAYKATLAEGEELDQAALDEAIQNALEAADDRFTDIENNLASSLLAYETAVSAGDFSSSGQTVLNTLGITDVSYSQQADGSLSYSYDATSGVTVVGASDAEITYNGASFTGSSNSFSINGLTFDVNGKTEAGEVITVNVSNDTDAAYNVVKNFVKQYNEVLKEMNDLYYAGSARGYEPLTDEERDAMTDDQIEKWETKIKDSLLRNDSSLGTVLTALKGSIQSTITIDDKTYSLASFGIGTSTDYSEKGLLHLNGDPDDSYANSFDDKLRAALAEDTDSVMKALSGIFQNVYSTMGEKMKASSVSSAFTFYNDKELDKTMKNYKTELSTLEDRLQEIEDRYYKQFTAMEKAMADLQSKQNSMASLLGNYTQ